MEKPLISVIIPRYRESVDEVETAILSLKSFFKKKPYSLETIVCQNGVRLKKTHFPNSKYIFTREGGLGVALKKGITAAKGKYILLFSCDVPFQFSDIKNFLPIIHKFDIIFSSKLHPDSIYKINPIRKTLTYIQYIYTHFFFPRFPIKDPNGSFIGKASVLKKLNSYNHCSDYFYTTKMALLAYLKQYKITEVPVRYIKTNFNTSVKIYSYGLSFIKQVILLWQQKHKYDQKI